MAINQNHLFEELDGVKCAIVEKNVSPERVTFLKDLLGLNGYTVVIVPSPPPKTAAAPKPAPANPNTESSVPVQEAAQPPAVDTPPPSTFTVGVTDVTFNPVNAIFGRLLKTSNGHVVTQAYWYQKERESHGEIPYYEWAK